jgi:hypothetical protein
MFVRSSLSDAAEVPATSALANSDMGESEQPRLEQPPPQFLTYNRNDAEGRLSTDCGSAGKVLCGTQPLRYSHHSNWEANS